MKERQAPERGIEYVSVLKTERCFAQLSVSVPKKAPTTRLKARTFFGVRSDKAHGDFVAT
jgi:hypothetical protein